MIQAEINMVPFLDVLLILLVIFMMIPAQLIHSFDVNLPISSISKKSVVNSKSLLTIEIKEVGLYNVSINNENKSKIHNLEQLYTTIDDIFRMNPQLTCILAADKNIQYESVIQVLNLLNNIGIYSVGMLVKTRN